jgi:ribosomal protein L7/L12
MKREPTPEEYEKITQAVFGNDRVEATSMYLSITECGLTEAQEFIKTLTAELKESNPDKFARKKVGKRNWLAT